MTREEVIIDSLIATIEEKNDLILSLEEKIKQEQAKRMATEEAFRKYVYEQEVKESAEYV